MTERTKEQFMHAARGLTAHQTAVALGGITRGTDWRGCTKGYLAERWVRAETARPYLDSSDSRLKLASLDRLEDVFDAARAKVVAERFRALDWNVYGREMYRALKKIGDATNGDTMIEACADAAALLRRINKENKL